MPIHPQYTEFHETTNPMRADVGMECHIFENRSFKLIYRPPTFFDSFKNFFNISALFSSIRAMLASLFAPSHEAKEIRGRLKYITESNETIENVNSAAGELLQSLRKKPADISLTEAHKIREDSVISLFNKGSFQAIVENYADWQTEGSPKEGEVWQRAYDELETLNLSKQDPIITALLFSKADVRYSGSEKIEQKLAFGKALVSHNYYDACAAIERLSVNEPDSTKKSANEKAFGLLKSSFITYQMDQGNFTKYDDLLKAWLQLNLAVEDMPSVQALMSRGYTNPSDECIIHQVRLLNNSSHALVILQDEMIKDGDAGRNTDSLQTACDLLTKAKKKLETLTDIDEHKLEALGRECLTAVAGTSAEAVMKKNYPFKLPG